MNERISIIIPCYNCQSTIAQTLESVFAQSFQSFTVYCINDGSTDNTGIILDQWSLRHKNLHVIHQKNQGQTKAKNKGIKISKGKYIAFLDSDDLWEPDKLLFQYALMEKKPDVGLCYTNGLYINSQNEPQGEIGISTALQGKCLSTLLLGNAIVASSVMIRSTLLETTGLFDETLTACENWELWTRFASVSNLAVIDKPLTLYRRHANNMSHNLEKMRLNRLRVVDKNSKRYKDKIPNSAVLIKETFYKAHRFFGENYLWKLQLSKARYDILQALRYKPFDFKLYLLYLKSLLGERLLSRIRQYRRFPQQPA